MVTRKRLLGDRRMAQHVERHLVERDAGQLERARRAGDALDVAQHLRRLAEQHVHRHVDRRSLAGPSSSDQPALLGRDADDRVRAALARAHRLEQRQAVGRDGQHVALLALVAPDLLRREAALLERDLREVETRAAAGAVDQLGKGVREAARADIVDGEDRIRFAERRAVVDDLLRAALDLRVAALHRVEVELGGVRARGHRARRAAAHADAHAGAAELQQQRAGREHRLCVCVAAIVPRPPASMIGL